MTRAPLLTVAEVAELLSVSPEHARPCANRKQDEAMSMTEEQICKRLGIRVQPSGGSKFGKSSSMMVAALSAASRQETVVLIYSTKEEATAAKNQIDEWARKLGLDASLVKCEGGVNGAGRKGVTR